MRAAVVRRKMELTLTAAMAVLAVGAYGGEAEARFFDWETFRVMQELRLETVDAGKEISVLSGLEIAPERISAGDAASALVGGSTAAARPGLRIGSFRLFVNRSGRELRDRELFPPGNDRNGALDMIKTLPGGLRTDPSKLMVDSVGKLFEPQLNLGIEF